MKSEYRIIYWRDILSQVKVRSTGRQRLSRPLPERFLVAIDETAMRADLTGSEDYLTQWRNGAWQERDGEMDAVAAAIVARLQTDYTPERLRILIRQNGLEEAGE